MTTFFVLITLLNEVYTFFSLFGIMSANLLTLNFEGRHFILHLVQDQLLYFLTEATIPYVLTLCLIQPILISCLPSLSSGTGPWNFPALH